MTDYIEPPRRQFDSRPVRDATLDDLNLDRVAAHIQAAIKRGRYHGTTETIPFLIQHHALSVGDDGETLIPTIAGIMLFGHNPQAIFPQAVVDLGHFFGTLPVSYEVSHLEKNIGGCLTDQIDQVERYLWNNTHHGFRLGDGAQRIDEPEYLRFVLREVTVNAVAHRDYTYYQSVIRVSLFRDRIEWVSPGTLPDGVTIDTILNRQVSRNPAIVMLLHQVGYIESFGMGLDTVFRALEGEGLRSPLLEESPVSFTVTVHGRPRSGPVQAAQTPVLTDIQQQLYDIILLRGTISIQDATDLFPDRSPRSLQRDLGGLIDLSLVITSGAARALRYHPSPINGLGENRDKSRHG